MLDASGSMMDTTAAGPTKWAAVKTALSGFVNDPKSAGIGVGLQIFPITHAGAPACTTSASCTVGGVNLGHCTTKACQPVAATDPISFCETAADCPGTKPCEPLGTCVFGVITNGGCLKGDPIYDCGAPFKCQVPATGSCDGEECVEADYSAAAKVPIATLPGNAGTFTAALNALPDPAPTSLTPTSVAEKGALDLAKAYAAANPTHVVVVVLATDGLPTRCSPQDIPSIAAIANTGVTGTPSIKTFVIGVFSDAEAPTSTPNLNAIAAGGGTTSAFIVSTASSVTTQFQAALDKIRGSSLPCEYTIPASEGGAPDYSKVNVQYTTGAGAKNLLGYKTSAAGCDAAGGWYYDVDPAAGAPTKIIVCPATCDAIKKDTGTAKVDILLGCATIVK